jgi:hypothetical protein
MKKIKYKVVIGENGFKDFEEKVETLLNEGWKTIGGIAFNSGHPHQGLAKIEEPTEEKPKLLGAIEAMKRLDDLT